MLQKRLINYFWAAAFFGWAVIILVLSIIPTSGLIEESNDPDNFRWDYVEHFGVFVLFAVLFGLWRRGRLGCGVRGAGYRLRVAGCWVPGAGYAVFTEVLQIWVDGRTFNPVDMYFNLGGFVVGLLISYKFILRDSS